MGDGIKGNLKMTGISVLVILVLITILQNTDPVEIQFLWMNSKPPLAVLLFVTFVVGFGSGYALFFWRQKKGKGASEEEAVIE